MSNSSGSDVEMEEEFQDLDAEIEVAKRKLDSDQYNIDANNTYISLLGKNGDFEELLDFRKKFCQWGPLNAENWISWIKDLRESGASYETVNETFEKAVADSNSLQVWMERISVAAGVSAEEARRICEEAITAVGTRFDVGGNIWMAYIDMEILFIKMASDEESHKKQLGRVNSLLKRALSVPIVDRDEIYEVAKKFAEEFDHNLLVEYKKLYSDLSKEYAQVEQLENAIKKDGYKPESFHALFEYYQKKDDPGRIQMVHERSVEKNSQHEFAWIQYGGWCEQKLKVHEVTCKVYERAVKHCPYSCPLFQQALLAFERAGQTEEKIDALWVSAKSNCISSSESGRALYRTYIYLLRRRCAASGADFSPLAAVFEEGEELLKEYFPHDWDPQCQYRRNQAWFYASIGKNIEKSRKVWEDILASGSGRYAAKWIEAVRLERQFGDKEHVRRILNKALNSVSDNPNEIYEYYIQFEREEGTLEELDRVLEKVNAQVHHRAGRPQKKEPEHPKQDKKRKETTKRETAGAAKKTKPEESIKDSDGFAIPAFKPRATTTAAVTRDLSNVSMDADGKWTVFVSNLDFKATEEDIKQVLDGVVEVRFGTKIGSKVHRGFAFVVVDSEEHAKEALAKDRTLVNGRPMLISENNPEKRVGFKYATGVEKKKLFVRNVHFAATEQQLREVFELFGELEAVRLVLHKSGQPKGVAYIDFKEEEAAEKVLKEEKIMLMDRALSVAISNPPKKGEKRVESEFKIRSFEEVPGQRKGHAGMLQMVPRAARPGNPDPGNGAEKPKPMSNDQFRQFLMKK